MRMERDHRVGGLVTGRALPAVTLGISVVAALATLILLALGAGESTPPDSFGLTGFGGLSFLVASLVFATVGATVAARLPDHPVGRLLCLIAVMLGLGNLAFQYADQALFVASDGPPGGVTAAWVQNLAVPPVFGLLAVALLLFPDGRLASRGWRVALGLALAGIAFSVVGYALRPGPMDDPFDDISNPVGIDGLFDVTDALSGLGWMLMTGSIGLAALSMSIRLRRSRGLEHQQLKWIAFAASIAGVALAANLISWFALGDSDEVAQLRIAIVGMALSAFPVAAGAAILRYRLYDIDLVINRALVYGTLSVALGGSYVFVVLLLQFALEPLTSGSQLAVAVSTLAVAALFRPARARIQDGVDRRFFRRRYDAARTLDRFSALTRREVELAALSAELRAVVDETMQPAHVSLWLREVTR